MASREKNARPHSSVILSNKIYVIGADTDAADAVECYNIAQNRWSSVAAMRVGRRNFACAVINEHIYVLGGRNSSNQFIDTVEKYDESIDRWCLVSN